MLIIARRVGESIVIDDTTNVKILGVRGKQIFLGIKAPLSIVVDREEIHERKKTRDWLPDPENA